NTGDIGATESASVITDQSVEEHFNGLFEEKHLRHGVETTGVKTTGSITSTSNLRYAARLPPARWLSVLPRPQSAQKNLVSWSTANANASRGSTPSTGANSRLQDACSLNAYACSSPRRASCAPTLWARTAQFGPMAVSSGDRWGAKAVIDGGGGGCGGCGGGRVSPTPARSEAESGGRVSPTPAQNDAASGSGRVSPKPARNDAAADGGGSGGRAAPAIPGRSGPSLSSARSGSSNPVLPAARSATPGATAGACWALEEFVGQLAAEAAASSAPGAAAAVAERHRLSFRDDDFIDDGGRRTDPWTSACGTSPTCFGPSRDRARVPPSRPLGASTPRCPQEKKKKKKKSTASSATKNDLRRCTF
ncbi:MAG: hypothetical protein BJ554DRAFT_1278, partial [Olpidium bornovanus]